MKRSIGLEEWYPVLVIERYEPNLHLDSIDVSEEFIAEYESVMRTFHEMQGRLRKMAPNYDD